MGSVKDLEVLRRPTQQEMGIGRFHFSDRYSVFDWGEMPDHIECKGAALCMMGAYCFERLEEKNVRTHYRGVVDDEGRVRRFDELEKPSKIMEINLVNVYKPKPYFEDGMMKYDYSFYNPKLTNFLIPLEIIYRNGLPEGSSVFKRLKEGLVTLKDLGLEHDPKPGMRLEKPIFDVSTKLEASDRYVSWAEAMEIAGLTEVEVEEIKLLLLKVNETISEMASKAGLVNEDGKIELAFDPKRRLMVVDVVGTLDECRFTYEGLHVSKEIARMYYKRIGWYAIADKAKKMAREKGVEDWRMLVKMEPPKLDCKPKRIISQMYMAAANEMTGVKFFDVPKLSEVIKECRDFGFT